MENYEIAISEFVERKEKLSCYPSVLYIESVKGCPYTCVMCKPHSTKPEKISQEILKKIEPFFPHLEILAIHGYGEPLFADLDYFIAQSIEHDFVLHMNTTGFFLTQRMADNLLKTRTSIWFSIHSGSEQTYKNIMGADFRKVVRNIKRITLHPDYNKDKHDFGFSFIVMKENIDEIEQFLGLAYECNIKKVRFMPLLPNGKKEEIRKIRGLNFCYEDQFDGSVLAQFKNELNGFLKTAENYGIEVEYLPVLKKNSPQSFLHRAVNKISRKALNTNVLPLKRAKSKYTCPAPWFGQMNVDQDGAVQLCCASSVKIGHIDDLKGLWNSSVLEKIRRSFKDGKTPKFCGTCQGYSLEGFPKNSFKR